MDTDKKRILLISASVLLIIILGAIGGYYYMKKSTPPFTSDSRAATQGVLPSIGAAANPLTNKPDINPTSKTNPFNSVKTNPFQ